MPETRKRDKSPKKRRVQSKSIKHKSEFISGGHVTREGPVRIEVSGTTYIRVRPGTVLLFEAGSKVTLSTRSSALVLQTAHLEGERDTLRYQTQGEDMVFVNGLQSA